MSARQLPRCAGVSFCPCTLGSCRAWSCPDRAGRVQGSLTAQEVAEAVAIGLHRARPDVEIRAVPMPTAATERGSRAGRWVSVGSGAGDGAAGRTGGGRDRRRRRNRGRRARLSVRTGTARGHRARAVDRDQLGHRRGRSSGPGREGARRGARRRWQRMHRRRRRNAHRPGGTGIGRDGNPLPPPSGGVLAGVSAVDISGLDPRLAEPSIVLASDVDNPLLGERGAAHAHGPQKGADELQVRFLDKALTRFAGAIATAGGRDGVEQPGAGAAGGVGFGTLAVLGARRCPGVEVVLELVDFNRRLAGADLVITGEGSRRADPVRQGPGRGRLPRGHGRSVGCRGRRAPPVDRRTFASSGHRRRLRPRGPRIRLAALHQRGGSPADRPRREARRRLERLGKRRRHAVSGVRHRGARSIRSA